MLEGGKKILVDTLWEMKDSKKCTVKLGMRKLTIHVFMWLKLKKKVNIVTSRKAKTHILNAFPKLKLFSFVNNLLSAKDCDDLTIGFDRNRDNRQGKLTNNKNKKGNYLLRIMLRDVIGLVEHQEMSTFSSGYKLTLTRKNESSVLNKADPTNIGKSKMNAIQWYVPKYSPIVPQPAILSNQTLSKTPTESEYVGRSVFMKKVNTHTYWTFELGSKEGKSVPIWMIIGF